MNKAKRLEIFERLSEAIPNPETELNYSNPFELLIAVILSAQATDKGVNIATDKLFPVANTPDPVALRTGQSRRAIGQRKNEKDGVLGQNGARPSL